MRALRSFWGPRAAPRKMAVTADRDRLQALVEVSRLAVLRELLQQVRPLRAVLRHWAAARAPALPEQEALMLPVAREQAVSAGLLPGARRAA